MKLKNIDKTQFVLDNKSYFYKEVHKEIDNPILETENGIKIGLRHIQIGSNTYEMSEDEIKSLVGWISANTETDFGFYKLRFINNPPESYSLDKNENSIDKSLRILEYSQIPDSCSCGNDLENFAKLHVKIIVSPLSDLTRFKLRVKDVLCLECSNPELVGSTDCQKHRDSIEKDLILTYSISQGLNTHVFHSYMRDSTNIEEKECVFLDSLEYSTRRWFNKKQRDYNRIRNIMLNSKTNCIGCSLHEEKSDSSIKLYHLTKDNIKRPDSLKFQNFLPVCESCESAIENKETIKEMKKLLPIYVKYIKQNPSLELNRDTLIEIASGSRFSRTELEKHKRRVINSECEIFEGGI